MITSRHTWGPPLEKGKTYWLNGTHECTVLDFTDVTAKVRMAHSGSVAHVDRDQLQEQPGRNTIARQLEQMEPRPPARTVVPKPVSDPATPEPEAPQPVSPVGPPTADILVTPKLVCPECGRKDFKRTQDLGKHRRFVHGVAGSSQASKWRAKAGVTPPSPVPPAAPAAVPEPKATPRQAEVPKPGPNDDIMPWLRQELARKRTEREELDQLINALEVVIQMYERWME